MQLPIPVKGFVFVVGTVALAFSSLVVFHRLGLRSYAEYTPSNEYVASPHGSVLPQTPSAESIERIVFGEQKGVWSPIRLSIPRINVVATVLHAGLTPTGAMDVPSTPDDVMWFDLGPRPGERGSAVISGHYGWKNGTPAVFDNLHKLARGDKITTEDEMGLKTTFVVRKLQKLKEDEDARAVFASNDGGVYLNLITCAGEWNKGRKSYSERLVVFADKVEE